MSKPIQSKEFNELEQGISCGFIKTFATKAAALSEASRWGWTGRAVRVQRRFETIWIVGQMDFQPDEFQGLEWDVLRIPALRYEKVNGVTTQPVLKCRRLRRAAA